MLSNAKQDVASLLKERHRGLAKHDLQRHDYGWPKPRRVFGLVAGKRATIARWFTVALPRLNFVCRVVSTTPNKSKMFTMIPARRIGNCSEPAVLHNANGAEIELDRLLMVFLPEGCDAVSGVKHSRLKPSSPVTCVFFSTTSENESPRPLSEYHPRRLV